MYSISTENRQLYSQTEALWELIFFLIFFLAENFLGYRERTTQKSHKNIVPQGCRKMRCNFFSFKEQSRRIMILILRPRVWKLCSLFLNIWSIYALLTLFASWFCSIPGPIRLAIPELIPLKFIAAHASVKAGSFVLQANRGAQIWKDLAILNDGETWTRNGCEITKHNSDVDNSSEVEMWLFGVQCLGKTRRKPQWSSVVKSIKHVWSNLPTAWWHDCSCFDGPLTS